MMPMTPSGTRTRSMVMPFGRVQDSVTRPTGSFSARTTSMPAAMASTRASSSARRSRKAPDRPDARASLMSSALAARIARLLRPDRRGHGSERAVLLLGGRERQRPGGRARLAPDCAHDGGNIAGTLDAFQRRGHFREILGLNLVKSLNGVVFLTRRGSGGEIGRSKAFRSSQSWG